MDSEGNVTGVEFSRLLLGWNQARGRDLTWFPLHVDRFRGDLDTTRIISRLGIAGVVG
jgi:hypothetical protein